KVHERRSDGAGANPTHVFAEEAASGFTEAAHFKVFHAEGLDDAITGGGFLQDLRDITETKLAIFRGTADLAAEFVGGPYHQRQKNSGRKGHFPVDDEKNGDEDEEGETFLKEVDEEFAEGGAGAIDVVDDDGEKLAGRMITKETDRLAQDFREDAVAKV